MADNEIRLMQHHVSSLFQDAYCEACSISADGFAVWYFSPCFRLRFDGNVFWLGVTGTNDG